ncbi:MAG: lipid-A-disaccharide synthase [Saprospiraceae bacterium]|nr:lipid-A-disaccharide synthase [Saprospiraceae bacterium]
MKFYIIAGEASGDLHGGNLLKALKAHASDVQCRAWGGDLMQQAGATLVKHYRELAFMGFIEVAKNLRTILKNIDFCKTDILNYKPDAIILIDYPGFNLRIAKWAKMQGIRVIYYISPQIWAWHQSRVHAIKRDVDQMLVILPFEKSFYQQFDMEVAYVGHPLLDAIVQSMQHEPSKPVSADKPIIALLPGSRKQEVQRILPRMLSVTADFPEYQFVVAGAKSLPEDIYIQIMKPYSEVRFVKDQTYDLLRQSKAALVKSGTSTLETALFDVPQVVCYAGSTVSYHVAKRLIKVPYISLVNLVASAPLVRELIQAELNRTNLKLALSEILNEEKAAKIKQDYAKLRTLLGGGGASDKAAVNILEYLKGRSNFSYNF